MMNNIQICLIVGIFLIIILGAGVECEECLPGSECMDVGKACTMSNGKAGTCYIQTMLTCICSDMPSPAFCSGDADCGSVGKCCNGQCVSSADECCGQGSDAGVCTGGTRCCMKGLQVSGCYDPATKFCCPNGLICPLGNSCCNQMCCQKDCCEYRAYVTDPLTLVESDIGPMQYTCIDKAQVQCCEERLCPVGDECCGEECCEKNSDKPHCLKWDYWDGPNQAEQCVACTQDSQCDDQDPCTTDYCDINLLSSVERKCLHPDRCKAIGDNYRCVEDECVEVCNVEERMLCSIDGFYMKVFEIWNAEQNRCNLKMIETIISCTKHPCDPSRDTILRECTEGDLRCSRKECQQQSDGSYAWTETSSQTCSLGRCEIGSDGDCGCV